MSCKNRAKVYLGYEDEYIDDKNRSLVNFTTNKIGGEPDLYDSELSLPKPICKQCGRKQLMVLQLYAPLENSKYHRTLYLFACINQECFNKNNAWTCLRVQALDEKSTNVTESVAPTNITITQPTISWLSSADDWGDDENDNISEQNGNNMPNDSRKLDLYMKASDIDKELNENLSSLSVNDQNMNISPTSMEFPIDDGATGKIDSPQASAEIEGEESEVVCIDTPTMPQKNLRHYLQDSSCHPSRHLDEFNLSFVEFFIAVEEENLSLDISQHVHDLFLEYQLCNPDASDVNFDFSKPSEQSKSIETNPEKYEKSIPEHGDEMFHHLISRIQKNPGQLLRYCRDNSAPLPINPISTTIGSCEYCGADRIFEIQILPTIIPKLEVQPVNDFIFEMEFGTILVFTCSNSCWSMNHAYREEFVIAQAEKFQ